MKIETFQMERWQSEWEHFVDFNLSESGVHPLSIEELVSPEKFNTILKTRLGYIQTNGTAELKSRICQTYTDASPDNILVTTGTSEANFLLMWSLIKPGDEAIFMLPNFLQMQGLIRAFGASAEPFYLEEKSGWQPDLNQLKNSINKSTKLIILTNPNNPTGSQLTDEIRETIIDLARRADAWLVIDEVYQGAELDGNITPSFWGTYEKAVITCGFSKAYGLPGLRIGWIVGPPDLINKIWKYKDYTSITISTVSDLLAQNALIPDNRLRIFERTRDIIRKNYQTLDTWMKKQKGLFSCIPPKSGAIAFPHYNLNINSTELAHKLRELKGVLICPGDQFGMDHYIRLGLGETSGHFLEGLNLIEEGLSEIRETI